MSELLGGIREVLTRQVIRGQESHGRIPIWNRGLDQYKTVGFPDDPAAFKRND